MRDCCSRRRGSLSWVCLTLHNLSMKWYDQKNLCRDSKIQLQLRLNQRELVNFSKLMNFTKIKSSLPGWFSFCFFLELCVHVGQVSLDAWLSCRLHWHNVLFCFTSDQPHHLRGGLGCVGWGCWVLGGAQQLGRTLGEWPPPPYPIPTPLALIHPRPFALIHPTTLALIHPTTLALIPPPPSPLPPPFTFQAL